MDQGSIKSFELKHRIKSNLRINRVEARHTKNLKKSTVQIHVPIPNAFTMQRNHIDHGLILIVTENRKL